MTAKPFLKWAGGKTQLIKDIERNLPNEIINKKFTYIEPFVGSGAVLFWILNNFPKLEKAIINDINIDLINTYREIANNPKELIELLKLYQFEFHNFDDSIVENIEKKKEYFYFKRQQFNTHNNSTLIQSALFIFLNKTCFNGLYRVNSKNEFNVPMGSYKKPLICDEYNLLAVSQKLQNVEILNGDFESTIKSAGENSFFYFDPPYKPLNETSSFNSYAKDNFDDKEQIRLMNFCKKLEGKGYKWMLSNSDVTNHNKNNSFFDDMYSDFLIKRVKAKRSINSNAEKRGQLNELLITNYQGGYSLL
jgi:DNA adenine methylase